MISLFRSLQPKEAVVFGADPGEGVSFCAAVGISIERRDTPLTFHARTESSQFGWELWRLGRYVFRETGSWPLLAVERNTGQATIAKLKDLEYPPARLYRQRTFDRLAQKAEERIGWVTSRGNRRKMLDDLAMAVRRRDLKILDGAVVKEMLTFVVDERRNEPRPESGTFSDLIMATAIAWQMCKLGSGGGSWLTPRRKPLKGKPTIPTRAEGFIVEKWEPKRDWRAV